MKILAFVDLHLNQRALKKLEAKARVHKPNLVICAGDYTVFDNRLEWVLRKISRLGKLVFIIGGNHESPQDTRKAIKKFPNILWIGNMIVEFRDLTFIGWGGGGFGYNDCEFTSFVRKNRDKLKRKNLVLVTHAPPFNTKVDGIYGTHVGNKDYKKFVLEYKNRLKLYVCGHLHETAKKKHKIGNCLIINPGPEGAIIKM